MPSIALFVMDCMWSSNDLPILLPDANYFSYSSKLGDKTTGLKQWPGCCMVPSSMTATLARYSPSKVKLQSEFGKITEERTPAAVIK